MPNIMLTSKCNLHCSYCFANSLVNQNDANDITLENFQTALNFVTSSGPTKIGLIGGEPTLHHQFTSIIEMALKQDLAKIVTLCTNGIALEPYLDILNSPKIQILFNCNATPNISDAQEQQLLNNIEKYFSIPGNIGTLGINVYNNDIDCTYIFELAKKYNQKSIRLSITIPSLNICNEMTYEEYFNTRKQKLSEVMQLAQKYKIQCNFDCDVPPNCNLMLHKQWLDAKSNEAMCAPIIDIDTDLSAIRCFGTSHLGKVKITDFPNLQALKEYFIETIDKPASKIVTHKRCINCPLHINQQCFGGCIRFKTKELLNGNY